MSNKCKMRFSLIVAGALLVIVYLFDNIQYTFGRVPDVVTLIEGHRMKKKEKASLASERIKDTSCFFINTGFDPALADVKYGQVKITDREKLLRLLQELERYDNYKEVFIDIRFEEGVSTEYDSLLVDQILRMRNVFVAKHRNPERVNHSNSSDFPLIDSRLLEHAAYADYGSTLFDNSFIKYQYLQANGPSAALKLYEDTNGGDRRIRRFGCGFFSLYFDKWCLCFNSSFIRLDEDMSDWEYCVNNEKYVNLGERILEEWEDSPEYKDYFYSGFQDKIIIIGDFVFDTHDTYFNKQPGPYLTYLAYSTLRDRKHIVKPAVAIAVYILYILILLMILHFTLPSSKYSFRLSKAKQKIKDFCLRLGQMKLLGWTRRFHHLFRFLMSLIGYSALFFLVSVLFYVTIDVSLSVFIPSIVFSSIDYIYQYCSYES